MSLSLFKASREGDLVRPLLMDDQVVAEMEALSRIGQPAVIALDRRANLLPSLSDTGKQHVGRWVRDILGARGWRPVTRKRVAKGRMFTSGAVYERSGPAGASAASRQGPPASTAAERLERARAIVRSGRARLPTVNEFIADKRRQARLER